MKEECEEEQNSGWYFIKGKHIWRRISFQPISLYKQEKDAHSPK